MLEKLHSWKFYLNGGWKQRDERIDVLNPFDGQVIDTAMHFAREVDSSNIHINWGPVWRADAMPYGGLKGSGTGKEGPKFAIEEMTEMKTVVIHSK